MASEDHDNPQRRVAAFFVLAFAISWGFWGLAIVARDTPLALVGYYGGGFGPFLAALVATRLSGRSPWDWFRTLWKWRVPFRFWVFTFGFPVLLALLASAIHGLLGGEIVLRDIGARMVSWAPVFAAVTLIGGGNEEPGWRGFALPALQERLSSFTATLVVGVVWALWHLPLIGVRGGGFGAFWMNGPELLAAGLTLLSITTHAFWYTWLYNRTGGVLLCVLLHGGYNAANARFVLVPEDSLHGADERQLLLVMTGLLAASVALLLAVTRGRLGR